MMRKKWHAHAHAHIVIMANTRMHTLTRAFGSLGSKTIHVLLILSGGTIATTSTGASRC